TVSRCCSLVQTQLKHTQ
ncbi:tat (twin-arginine translocation) pathway signal sequence domain protein, partial [Vibrio parahaemolyticus 861]